MSVERQFSFLGRCWNEQNLTNWRHNECDRIYCRLRTTEKSGVPRLVHNFPEDSIIYAKLQWNFATLCNKGISSGSFAHCAIEVTFPLVVTTTIIVCKPKASRVNWPCSGTWWVLTALNSVRAKCLKWMNWVPIRYRKLVKTSPARRIFELGEKLDKLNSNEFKWS